MAGFIFPIFSSAQTTPYRSYFGNEFTHWYVYNSMLDAAAHSEMYSVNNEDTLLNNGISYKKTYRYSTLENLTQLPPVYCFGIREEIGTGSLFVTTEDSSEILVSRMDLKIGDKYYFPPFKTDFNQISAYGNYFINVQEDENGYYTTVDSVYYEDDRKYIRFEAIYHGINFDLPLTFIEGIGPNVSFVPFYTSNTCMAVCCNCYETENGLWKSDIIQMEECFLELTGIPQIETNIPLQLIQRKGEIELRPDAGNFVSGWVYMYSTEGKLLYSQPAKRDAAIVISTSGFSKGTYIIQLTEENTKKMWNRKVIL